MHDNPYIQIKNGNPKTEKQESLIALKFMPIRSFPPKFLVVLDMAIGLSCGYALCRERKGVVNMASIRKRGSSYLIIVSRGYDYQGNRIKPAQKTVHPPQGLTEKQTERWLNEQAVLYEMEVKHTAPVDRSITLAKYIEIWLEHVASKKLALSTLTRDRQDIRRILPKLGHYKLADLNKDILCDFYEEMRAE